MRFAMLVPLAATLMTPLAHAEWYADFGAGRATANGHRVPVVATNTGGDAIVDSFSFAPLAGSDTMYAARVGARVLPYLAFEAAYAHIGDYSLQTVTLDNPGTIMSFDSRVRSGGAAVVGILPLDRLDLYARLGYARTQVKAEATSADGTTIHVDDRFNEAYYGAGLRWNVTRELGLFAEYQKHDKLDLDGYLVGMQWRF